MRTRMKRGPNSYVLFENIEKKLNLLLGAFQTMKEKFTQISELFIALLPRGKELRRYDRSKCCLFLHSF